MKTYPTPLAAKVAARNRIHQATMDHLPAMLAALAPFVGKKVTLVGGQLTSKVRLSLPQDPFVANGCSEPTWSYTTGGYQCIRASFKVCCQTANGHGYYAECDATLGELDRHSCNLVKLVEGHAYRTDFTEAGVRAAWAKLDEAKRELSKAQGQPEIQYFGEFDR